MQKISFTKDGDDFLLKADGVSGDVRITNDTQKNFGIKNGSFFEATDEEGMLSSDFMFIVGNSPSQQWTLQIIQVKDELFQADVRALLENIDGAMLTIYVVDYHKYFVTNNEGDVATSYIATPTNTPNTGNYTLVDGIIMSANDPSVKAEQEKKLQELMSKKDEMVGFEGDCLEDYDYDELLAKNENALEFVVKSGIYAYDELYKADIKKQMTFYPRFGKKHTISSFDGKTFYKQKEVSEKSEFYFKLRRKKIVL